MCLIRHELLSEQQSYRNDDSQPADPPDMYLACSHTWLPGATGRDVLPVVVYSPAWGGVAFTVVAQLITFTWQVASMEPMSISGASVVSFILIFFTS
jgi:hypothetical protein